MINRVIMAGRLGADPEALKTASGVSITTFSVATERPYKNKTTGEYDVDFHDWRFYGQTADAIAKYLHKGDLVMCDGYAQRDSWTGKDGLKHNREVFVGEHVQFPPRANRPAEKPQVQEQQWNTGDVEVVGEDDLPF